jgi:hypothetical protein
MRISTVRTRMSAPRIAGWLVGVSLLGSPLGSSPATAQEDVRLAGVVAAERTLTPVPSAKVTLVGTDLETVSLENGTFEFADAPLGALAVKVEAPGFATMVEEVDVQPGVVVFVQFILPSVDAFLDEILVVGHRPEPTAALSEPHSAADLLVGKIPGIGSNSGLVGITLQQVKLRGVTSITIQHEPDVFLDGVRLAGGIQGALRTLELIPANDVSEIHILRGPTAAFLLGSADGAISVRTRSGSRK